MKTVSRFSAETQERWTRIGRGEGVGCEYKPWHQVTRGDPASRGRSHIQTHGITGRQQHYLSDAELIAAMCVWRLQGVRDVLEQLPLALQYAPSILTRYDDSKTYRICPGTRTIAEQLGIRHPKVRRRAGGQDDWVMSTDQCAIVQTAEGICATAISVKASSNLTERENQKLAVEQRYWEIRGHRWLLFTTEPIPYATRQSIMSIVGYVLPYSRPTNELSRTVAELVIASGSVDIRGAVEVSSRHFKVPRGLAISMVWQTIWLGLLSVDLVQAASRGKFLYVDPTLQGWDPLRGRCSS